MLILVSLGLLFLAAPVWSAVALGNLAVVIKNSKLISTDEEPLTGPAGDLWCQISVDDTIASMTSARFIRARDRKTFEAHLDEKKLKARLIFGHAPVTDAGKYRCEMKTQDDDLVYGNLFVLTRPVVHTNGSRKYKMAEHDPTLIEGEEVPVQLGENASISCPVVGFPVPNVVWFKDGLPVEAGGRVSFTPKNTLVIEKVEESDVGKYRCVASNQFAVIVDGPEQQFELKLDQNLVLSGNYSWILPLVIILIILLLVFICIYTWQACSRYNSANYNVARREQNLRREREDEQRRLTKETP